MNKKFTYIHYNNICTISESGGAKYKTRSEIFLTRPTSKYFLVTKFYSKFMYLTIISLFPRLVALSRQQPLYRIRWRSQVVRANNRLGPPTPAPAASAGSASPHHSLAILILLSLLFSLQNQRRVLCEVLETVQWKIIPTVQVFIIQQELCAKCKYDHLSY